MSERERREAVIEVRGLRNQFGTHVVHEDLSLTVNRGELIGVVGGSGTGKSVLMRAIIGLPKGTTAAEAESAIVGRLGPATRDELTAQVQARRERASG